MREIEREEIWWEVSRHRPTSIFLSSERSERRESERFCLNINCYILFLMITVNLVHRNQINLVTSSPFQR